MGLEISIYRDIKEVERLKEVWDLLAIRQSNPFLYFDWHQSWVKLSDGAYTLWTIVVRRGLKVVAICPWVIKKEKIPFPHKVLTWCGYSEVMPTVLDLLVIPEEWDEVKAELLKLLQTNTNFDRLDFPRIKQGGYMSELLLSLQGVSRETEVSSPVTSIDGKTLSKNFRKEMSRKIRALEALGAVRLDTYRSSEEIEQHFAEFEDLNQKRQGQNRQLLEFARKVSTDLAKRDAIRMRILRLNEKPIAGSLCLASVDRQFGYQSGFDPAYEELSPMSVLDRFRMEDLAESKEACIYDWGPGLDPYKLRFGFKENRVERIRSTQPTAKGKIWNLLFRSKRKAWNLRRDLKRVWSEQVVDLVMGETLERLNLQVPPGKETIRPLLVSDLDSLVPTLGESKVADFRERLKFGWGTGAWLNDQLVGYAWATNHPRLNEGEAPFTYIVDPPPGTLYFYDFFVIPEMRNKGTGARLRSVQIKQAMFHGFKFGFLTHGEENLPVIGLSKKFGFKEIGKISYRRTGMKVSKDTRALKSIEVPVLQEAVSPSRVV